MRTIWKFVLPVTDEQDLEFPKGATFLYVGQQGNPGEIVIWMAVDPSAPRVKRKVQIRGTGHPLTEREGIFLGTVSNQSSPFTPALVWHVFMEGGFQKDVIGDAWNKPVPTMPVGKAGS